MPEDTYQFNSLEEIYSQLDSEQIKRCLNDLASGLSQCKELEGMLTTLADATGEGSRKVCAAQFPVTWIDDDKRKVTVRAMVAGGGEFMRLETEQKE